MLTSAKENYVPRLEACNVWTNSTINQVIGQLKKSVLVEPVRCPEDLQKRKMARQVIDYLQAYKRVDMHHPYYEKMLFQRPREFKDDGSIQTSLDALHQRKCIKCGQSMALIRSKSVWQCYSAKCGHRQAFISAQTYVTVMQQHEGAGDLDDHASDQKLASVSKKPGAKKKGGVDSPKWCMTVLRRIDNFYRYESLVGGDSSLWNEFIGLILAYQKERTATSLAETIETICTNNPKFSAWQKVSVRRWILKKLEPNPPMVWTLDDWNWTKNVLARWSRLGESFAEMKAEFVYHYVCFCKQWISRAQYILCKYNATEFAQQLRILASEQTRKKLADSFPETQIVWKPIALNITLGEWKKHLFLEKK